MQNKKDVEAAEKAFLDEAAEKKSNHGGPLPYADWEDWVPT
jgi:hypothetical protein